MTGSGGAGILTGGSVSSGYINEGTAYPHPDETSGKAPYGSTPDSCVIRIPDDRTDGQQYADVSSIQDQRLSDQSHYTGREEAGYTTNMHTGTGRMYEGKDMAMHRIPEDTQTYGSGFANGLVNSDVDEDPPPRGSLLHASAVDARAADSMHTLQRGDKQTKGGKEYQGLSGSEDSQRGRSQGGVRHDPPTEYKSPVSATNDPHTSVRNHLRNYKHTVMHTYSDAHTQ